MTSDQELQLDPQGRDYWDSVDEMQSTTLKLQFLPGYLFGNVIVFMLCSLECNDIWQQSVTQCRMCSIYGKGQ